MADRAAEAARALEKLAAEKAENAKRHAKAEAEKSEPRASRTDPEARKMRFADGAVRAGYNVQLAVEPATNIILAVEATDRRNDSAFAGIMVEQIKTRLKARPGRLLVDTHYATREDIIALAADQVEVYAPPPPDKSGASAESQRKRRWYREREPAAVMAWRQRMADEASQMIYRRRSRIETTNAILKRRGLGIMPVRSLARVACVVLLQAIAHNLWRAHCLHTARA